MVQRDLVDDQLHLETRELYHGKWIHLGLTWSTHGIVVFCQYMICNGVWCSPRFGEHQTIILCSNSFVSSTHMFVNDGDNVISHCIESDAIAKSPTCWQTKTTSPLISAHSWVVALKPNSVCSMLTIICSQSAPASECPCNACPRGITYNASLYWY